jgi:hypothetical protein
VTRFPKIIALLAFGMAAGCRDSYPTVQPALDVLYFPVGLAVRQVGPTSAAPYGSSQLVVVNSNFDLRYDEQSGGTVLVVDPDTSQDTSLGGQLTVQGSARVASFGGEVGLVDSGCLPGWPDCPSACSTLAADPTVSAGGAKLIVASRSALTIYRMSMARDGSLTCGDGCPYVLPVDRLDPYGVSTACSTQAGYPVAYAFVSHLSPANNLGWLTRVNLLADADVVGLVLGLLPTYTSVYDARSDLVFVSSSVSAAAQFRWFNPLVTVSSVDGYAIPDFSSPVFANFLPGAAARDMALSADGKRLYVTVQLYDLALALQTGALYTQGGALAVFDVSESAYAEPRMALLGVQRTCLGAGQIRRLPTRAGKGELFAISCDTEGSLALYDAAAGNVVRTIGLDPTTGLPALGLQPFGLAVEPIDPRRATIPVAGSIYAPSPCGPGRDCQRIYVASFSDNWINVLELDPDRPATIALVKRIGRGP